MKPYIIYTPPYRHNSGGIKILHRLCHELNSHGYEAYVTTQVINPEWNTPLFKHVDNSIVVYPEIVEGNPLHVKNVVRYMLSRPGEVATVKFSENEHPVYFSRIFAPEGSEVFFIPTIELDLFTNSRESRYLTSYWLGRVKQPIFPPRDWLSITRTFPQSRKALAKIFQHSHVFYSYYPLTSLINEATLCGCPVVIVPEEGGSFSRSEYERSEYGMDGIAWGEEELPRAENTLGFVLNNHKKLYKKFPKDLAVFVERTQS